MSMRVALVIAGVSLFAGIAQAEEGEGPMRDVPLQVAQAAASAAAQAPDERSVRQLEEIVVTSDRSSAADPEKVSARAAEALRTLTEQD